MTRGKAPECAWCARKIRPDRVRRAEHDGVTRPFHARCLCDHDAWRRETGR